MFLFCALVLGRRVPRLTPFLLAFTATAFYSSGVGTITFKLGLIIGQFEINLAFIQVDARNRDPHRITQAIHLVAAFTDQAMVYRIKVIIIVFECGDVDQAFDVEILQLDKDPEVGDRGNNAIVLLTELIQHVFTLEPVNGVPCRLIGATLGHAAVFTQQQHLFVTDIKVAGLFLAEDMTDRTMHQQIRIATDRRSEMGIGLIGQSKVPEVIGGIDRLA